MLDTLISVRGTGSKVLTRGQWITFVLLILPLHQLVHINSPWFRPYRVSLDSTWSRLYMVETLHSWYTPQCKLQFNSSTFRLRSMGPCPLVITQSSLAKVLKELCIVQICYFLPYLRYMSDPLLPLMFSDPFHRCFSSAARSKFLPSVSLCTVTCRKGLDKLRYNI